MPSIGFQSAGSSPLISGYSSKLDRAAVRKDKRTCCRVCACQSILVNLSPFTAKPCIPTQATHKPVCHVDPHELA